MDIGFLLKQKKLCEACSARKEAKQVVLPIPNNSKIWILGRNPGREENEAGSPFIGRGGGMLDNWLDILGFPRYLFFVENALACHTLKDRQPDYEELKACSYWLDLEVRLIKPVLIITLGNDALRSATGLPGVSVTNMHGMLVTSRWSFAKVFPTFHPGHCLRQEKYKALAEAEDLPKLKVLLETVYASYMERGEAKSKKEAIGAGDRRISHLFKHR